MNQLVSKCELAVFTFIATAFMAGCFVCQALGHPLSDRGFDTIGGVLSILSTQYFSNRRSHRAMCENTAITQSVEKKVDKVSAKVNVSPTYQTLGGAAASVTRDKPKDKP